MSIQNNKVNRLVRSFGFPPPLGAKKLALSPVMQAASNRGGVTKSNINHEPINAAIKIKTTIVIARQIPNIARENIVFFVE
jgi:hypothetical protein